MKYRQPNCYENQYTEGLRKFLTQQVRNCKQKMFGELNAEKNIENTFSGKFEQKPFLFERLWEMFCREMKSRKLSKKAANFYLNICSNYPYIFQQVKTF